MVVSLTFASKSSLGISVIDQIQAIHAQTERQVAHWTLAASRLKLDDLASPEAWGRLERYLGVSLRRHLTGVIDRLQGDLILAAHSGGGVYMRRLALSGSQYAGKIRECWGLDSLYNSDDVDYGFGGQNLTLDPISTATTSNRVPRTIPNPSSGKQAN